MQLVCASGNCDSNECVELTGRESSICNAICNSSEPISFTQLRDVTSLHQEIVSRAIRRLTIHGLVVKENGKYSGKCRR